MRVALLSDLHTEMYSNQRIIENNGYFYPGDNAYDVVVLAGDIGSGLTGLKLWRETIPYKIPIVFVFGNHEFFNKNFCDLSEAAKNLNLPNTYILNPGHVTLDGVNFIGGTLWSSGLLKGYPDTRVQIERGINDFRLITAGVVDRFTVAYMNQLHQRDRKYISEQLDTLHGPKVLVTHFSPSQECVQKKYVGNSLVPYFTSDSDDLVAKADIVLFGHDHSRVDLIHSSGTPMHSNCLGYAREIPEPYNWKIINV